MNLGIGDKNLSRRFQKLNDKKTINDVFGEIDSGKIGEMDDITRTKLKTAIIDLETKEATAKDAEIQEVKTQKSEVTEALKAEAVKVVTDQGMEDGELEGDNKLVFIGAGTGGSSERDKMPTNMLMKNSTYYAATKVGEVYKQITSIDNKVVDGNKVEEIINVTKQAIIKIADVKGDNRTRLTGTLSNILTPLLPAGITNLKFANKAKQSLQIVLGYTVNDDKTISGKGRIQFVPKIGNPVSSIININNNKYSFDNKDILSNKEAGKTAEEVLNKLAGVTIKHDPNATAAATAAAAAAIVTPQPSPPGSPRIPDAAAAAGAQRQIDEQVNLASAAAAAANASADKVENHITNSSNAGGGESKASKNAKQARLAANQANAAVAKAIAAKDINDIDAVNAAAKDADTAAKDADTAAKDAVDASNPFNDDADDVLKGGKKRKTHRKKVNKNNSKKANTNNSKAKKAKGGKRTIKRRRKPKRGKC
jgi:hypothetical protein